MRILLKILLVLSSIYSFGQDDFERHFEKLETADTLTDSKMIAYYQSKSQFKNDDFFIYDGTLINRLLDNSFLFKKNKAGFIIYKLPFQNSSEIVFSKNENYLLKKVEYRSSARQIRGTSKEQIIIDLNNLSYIGLFTYNSVQSWEFGDDENMIVHNSACKSLMNIEDDFLTVHTLCYENDNFRNECEECISTGIYVIKGDILRKVKSYSERNLSMNDIEWIDSFCLGMSIDEFLRTNDKDVQEVPLFEYGYDSEEMGFEIINNGTAEYFLVVKEKEIVSVFVMSPEIDIHGINTSWTIKEVLKKYPNVKLHIDLISHWEYVFLKDQSLRLIFKTDSSNRIGNYGNDFEEGSIGLKEENKTIDLIQDIGKGSN